MQADETQQGDGLPGVWLVRGVMIALGLAFVVGLYLLFAPPTLPNERERTSAAPRPTVVNRATQPVRQPAAAPTAAAVAPTATPPSPTPAATAAASSPQAQRRHTIRPGDTLLAIAEQYDTTVDAIRAANPGLSETALQVGAEIAIPPSR